MAIAQQVSARVRLAAVTVVVLAVMLAPTTARAAFPGENGRIAYTRTLVNGASDIYSVEPSGFAEMRLTHDGQSANGAFSPDGTRLAYSAGPRIYIADQYGNDPQLVLDTGGGVGEIDWSPDGTRLVAAITNCAEFDCEYDIYVIGTDGADVTNLTGSIYSESNPSWSPDGSKIAFDAAFAGDEDIYTINPDGTGLENITLVEPAESAREPDWSPDATRIVFTYYGSSSRTMNPDGTDQVAGGAGPASAWAPDGTTFTSNGDVASRLVQGGAGAQTAGSVHDPDWQVRPPEPAPAATGSGYARPKGATPVYVPLVSAFQPCPTSTLPNAQHGPPLAYESCAPPRRAGPFGAMFGTPDSNGYAAEGSGYARFDTIVGIPATAEDEADVRVTVSIADVYLFAPSLGHPDYTSDLLLEMRVQITDRWNGGGADGSATVAEFPLRVVVPCLATPDETVGSNCGVSTTGDALTPGLVREGRRAVWRLGAVTVSTEGLDHDPEKIADNKRSFTGGVFIP